MMMYGCTYIVGEVVIRAGVFVAMVPWTGAADANTDSMMHGCTYMVGDVVLCEGDVSCHGRLDKSVSDEVHPHPWPPEGK